VIKKTQHRKIVSIDVFREIRNKLKYDYKSEKWLILEGKYKVTKAGEKKYISYLCIGKDRADFKHTIAVKTEKVSITIRRLDLYLKAPINLIRKFEDGIKNIQILLN